MRLEFPAPLPQKNGAEFSSQPRKKQYRYLQTHRARRPGGQEGGARGTRTRARTRTCSRSRAGPPMGKQGGERERERGGTSDTAGGRAAGRGARRAGGRGAHRARRLKGDGWCSRENGRCSPGRGRAAGLRLARPTGAARVMQRSSRALACAVCARGRCRSVPSTHLGAGLAQLLGERAPPAKEPYCAGQRRARSHYRSAPPRIHFIPDSRTD
jgi:hypothetical protein